MIRSIKNNRESSRLIHGEVGTDIFIFKNAPGSQLGQGYTVEIFENGVKTESTVVRTKDQAYQYIKDYKEFYHTNRAFQNQLGVHVTFKNKKERGETAMENIDSILYKKAQKIEELVNNLVDPLSLVKRRISNIREDIVPIPSSFEESAEKNKKEEDAIAEDMFNALQEYFSTTKDAIADQYNKVKHWIAKVKEDLLAAKKMGVEYNLQEISKALKQKFTPGVPGYDVISKKAVLLRDIPMETPSPVDVGVKSDVHDYDNLKEFVNKIRDTTMSPENIEIILDENFTTQDKEYMKKKLEDSNNKTISDYIIEDRLGSLKFIATKAMFEAFDQYHNMFVRPGATDFYYFISKNAKHGKTLESLYEEWVKSAKISNIDLIKDIWTYVKIHSVNLGNNKKASVYENETELSKWFRHAFLNLLYSRCAEAYDENFLQSFKQEFSQDLKLLVSRCVHISKDLAPYFKDKNKENQAQKKVDEVLTQDGEVSSLVDQTIQAGIRYAVMYSCTRFLLSANILQRLQKAGIKTSEGVYKFLKNNYSSFSIKSEGGIVDFASSVVRLFEEYKATIFNSNVFVSNEEKVAFSVIINKIASLCRDKIKQINITLGTAFATEPYKSEISQIIEDQIVPQLISRSAKYLKNVRTSTVVVKPDGTVVVDPEGKAIVEPSSNQQEHTIQDQDLGMKEEDDFANVDKSKSPFLKDIENNDIKEVEETRTDTNKTLLDLLWM